MSQRAIARVLGTTRKTVVRKFLFLGQQAKHSNERYLMRLGPVSDIQFDEMESSEHSKCKPLSIPLVVRAQDRKVLGFRVCEMPAKGPLAAISRNKYGPRKDERPQAARELFASLTPLLVKEPSILTDKNPKYPGWIRAHWPKASHATTRGRRGCVVGQGELKAGGFDPLFSLNHTAAMFRANVNRLFRRTWCTTKRRDRLALHMELYVQHHNQVRT